MHSSRHPLYMSQSSGPDGPGGNPDTGIRVG